MYLHNKYTAWYNSIISAAQARILSPEIYIEKHHIIPKSLGGSDAKSNLVVLTAREHFLCHWLLTKMLADSKQKIKMQFAFSAFAQNNKSQIREKVTGKKYEVMKKARSEALKSQNLGNKYAKGYTWTQEHRDNFVASKALNPNKNKPKPAIGEALKKKYREETYVHSGKTYAEIYGEEEAEKRKEKLRKPKVRTVKTNKPQARVTCPHCGKTGASGNMKKYHFNNCKLSPSATHSIV